MSVHHSLCAWCAQPSVWTVGPATTWQSPSRITQDVCGDHLAAAIERLMENNVGLAQVGRVVQYYRGVNVHSPAP